MKINQKLEYPKNLFDLLTGYLKENEKIKYTPEIEKRLIFVIEENNELVDDKTKEFIRLRFKECLSYKDIGEKFDRSIGSIRHIEYNVIRKLRYSTSFNFIICKTDTLPKFTFDTDFWRVNDTIMYFIEEEKENIRIKNAFLRTPKNISTFGEILNFSKNELYSIRNLGEKSINTIITYFERLGINADKFKS